jgi:hypothetical protein
VLVLSSLSGYRWVDHFWQVQPFLVAFFVMFSTMVFVHRLRESTPSNLLDVLMLFLNAGVFFGLSRGLISEAHGLPLDGLGFTGVGSMVSGPCQLDAASPQS